jgi:hypothetical protein
MVLLRAVQGRKSPLSNHGWISSPKRRESATIGRPRLGAECLFLGVPIACVACEGRPSAWEAELLPLNYTRKMLGFRRFYSLTVRRVPVEW